MKKIIAFASMAVLVIQVYAQPSVDINKLMKMTPAEREAYQKKIVQEAGQFASEQADKNKLPLDKSLIPGYEIKPPVKDLKKLTLIPSRPPTRTELVSDIRQSISQIQKGMPAPEIEKISTITRSLPVEKIQPKAIAAFYGDDQKAGLLMMMQMAAQQPDSLTLLNNLGAMLNLGGVSHKAIPLFQYCLERLPNSSMLLNNIGQSFMALGDMMRAADYFNKCLAVDSLNPEANHSMGMLHYFKKDYDAAMAYFERELSVAYRKTTMAMAYRMGRKFNLRELTKRRNKRKGAVEKDFLEEITMGKFSLPELPKNTKDIQLRKAELTAFAASLQAEQLFWMNNTTKLSLSYANKKGDEYPGIYSELVKAMLEELGKEFTPTYLSNYSDQDREQLKEIIQSYSTKLNNLKCPEAPAGSSVDVQEAYAINCCEKNKRPLADKFVNELNTFAEARHKPALLRWKSYINQLIAIVQLDPSPGNLGMVYNAVAGYFAQASEAMLYYTGGEVENFLPECSGKQTDLDTDSLIESERQWTLECPKWLNIEVDFEGMVVKADCNKYVVEAGSSIMGAYEYEFKSGQSTLLLGPGMKGDINGVLNWELKQQFYISFDNNKQFADFGFKRTTEAGISGTPLPLGGIKVGGNAAGVEISDKFGIMSGYNIEVEKKGIIAALFN